MFPTFETPQGAYLGTLKQVLARGNRVSPRRKPTLELTDYGFTVLNPSIDPIMTADAEVNEKVLAYTRKEFDLYDSGENRAAVYAKAAPMWEKLQNPDGTVNSAYGWLIFHNKSCGKTRFAKHGPLTPWEWAELSLKQDRDTRQAYLRFSLPKHQWFGNRDQVCTMHGLFRIRSGQLDLTMVMRSNDARRGLIYDMPWFCGLIPRMVASLHAHCPGLKPGTYSHFAHSMHLYETDLEEVQRMIGGAA